MSSPTKTVATLEVTETAGMRRFLYPLSATLHGKFDSARIRVAELDGTLVPSQARAWEYEGLHHVDLNFAISLAPRETRRLLVVETDQLPAIPDAITLIANPDGSCEAVQARFAHRIDSAGRLASVVYGGVEHLARPATITLDGAEGIGVARNEASIGGGLAGRLDYWGQYQAKGTSMDCQTTYYLTACKSWVNVRHHVYCSLDAGQLIFTLPTTIIGVATCDFGAGDGLYGKLQTGSVERIVWHTGVTDAPTWWIGSYAPGNAMVRVDAESVHPQKGNIFTEGWFHLIGRDKALAVAFRCRAKDCSRVVVSLDVNGLVGITFTTRKVTRAIFDVWYHFLDDIPPIAAATNPASILCPPTVQVLSA